MKRILLISLLLICCFSCGKKDSEEKTKEEIVIQSITCSEAKEKVYRDAAFLIDVRSEQEFDNGTIDGSINIPVDVIENKITSYVKDKDKDIIVFCQSGNRSNQAAQKLKDLGYKNIYDLGSINNCN